MYFIGYLYPWFFFNRAKNRQTNVPKTNVLTIAYDTKILAMISNQSY